MIEYDHLATQILTDPSIVMVVIFDIFIITIRFAFTAKRDSRLQYSLRYCLITASRLEDSLYYMHGGIMR